MTAIQGLIRDNIALLRQASVILSAVPPQTYTAEASPAVHSAGKHFRHIFNHYDALLLRPADAVDYETRERGTEMEGDPAAALQKAQAIIVQLEKLALAVPENSSLAVERIFRAADGMLHATRYPSTLARELDFVHQHTVHHFAMIALVLNHHGFTVAPEFGMSPSTLRFEGAVAPTH